MARHKWEEEQVTEYGTRPHRCINCGVRKMWRGGDYQSWEYIWCEAFTAMNGEEGVFLNGLRQNEIQSVLN